MPFLIRGTTIYRTAWLAQSQTGHHVAILVSNIEYEICRQTQCLLSLLVDLAGNAGIDIDRLVGSCEAFSPQALHGHINCNTVSIYISSSLGMFPP
jgi:hypothetical protein